MTAYTPGPWQFARREAHTSHIGPHVYAAEGGIVAFVSYDGAPRGSSAEAEANARLIAQAPAMAELLRGIVNDDPIYSDEAEGALCFHCYAQFSNYKGITHKPDCAYERARAILATIEGK